jgi:predicted ArsR family transcriptional regulator
MDQQHDLDRRLDGVAGLGDPRRRALYRYVSGHGSGHAVSREEAARAVGITRPLAAYHLDRLVDDGLLEASFGRRTGRRGPGAGRPAKLYRRAAGAVEVSLPARDYALLARMLATAVEADPSGAAGHALRRVARAVGEDLGAAETAADTAPGGLMERLRRALAGNGYEPVTAGDGTVRLRNCPFDLVAGEHREVVCDANRELLAGLVDRVGAGDRVDVRLDPRPGRCCVALAGLGEPRCGRAGPGAG